MHFKTVTVMMVANSSNLLPEKIAFYSHIGDGHLSFDLLNQTSADKETISPDSHVRQD